MWVALVASSVRSLLVAMPGAPSSVLSPSSDARVPSSFLLLVLMPFVSSSDALAPSKARSAPSSVPSAHRPPATNRFKVNGINVTVRLP